MLLARVADSRRPADLRALAALDSRIAVRAHPFDVHAKAPRLKQAHRCAWEATKRKRMGGNFSLVAAEVNCFDEHAPSTLWCSGAQGGALLVDRREDVASFVAGWLATYVKLYKGFASSQTWKGRGHFGADQTALHDLFASSKLCAKGAAADLSFGYLPNALNERTRPKRADCARPWRPASAGLASARASGWVRNGAAFRRGSPEAKRQNETSLWFRAHCL